MSLEITCHATSRAAAAALMQAAGIARLDAETGMFVPIAEVRITPSGGNDQWDVPVKTGNMIQNAFGQMVEEKVPLAGFSWNMEFFGTSEATLRKPEPEGGWPPGSDIFDMTYINELVQGRTGMIPNWVASANDPIPPGYQAGNCRAFDPSLISTRANVWA